VNLTLTDMEQRLLEAIVTDGTTEHDVFVQYLQRARHLVPGLSGDAPAPGLADVVHVVLKLGLERLEAESAEISYAAEASAATEADRATTAALRRRLAVIAARADG
jgi:hypothetical protein